jgi:hypothetical protein
MSVIAAPANRSNVSIWVAFVLLILGTLGAYLVVGVNQALLFLIGGALGMTLYHALLVLPRVGVSSLKSVVVVACVHK